MEEVDMVKCPAGVCGLEVAKCDPDRLFGHLLVDHSWTFDTAQRETVELIPTA